MEKQLRSLLHEKFDLDLRVEIEFLSRRRDLVNQEKQEELIKLLQSRNISNIVPLGPGTNRYAFKLDGFVIKVATDHDGKIDNLKEFKMAKRLYPYVTKTYEVSENGTMLVAEYIQPFESYTEMCKYADKIRAILEKLSSVYLIGDVGITPNNFANWGLRVGTEDPVCLDFAYVYEVSSKLFLCQYCTAHAMLVPNRDFTELHCSNPACGRRYLFEDIRTKIGNDIHNHEIGDLSLEGYKLFSSGVLTELTEDRSNYLVKKKTKKEIVAPVTEEVPFVDNFVMEQPLSTIKGGNNMSRIENAVKVAATLASKPAPGVLRVQATAMPSGFKQPAPQAPAPTQVISEEPKSAVPEETSGLGGLKRAQAVVISNGSEEMPKDLPMSHPPLTSTLAFQGTMTGSAEPVPQAEKMPVPPAPTPAPVPATPAVIVGEMHANLMQQRPEPVKATASIAVPATAAPVQPEEEPEAEPEVQPQVQDNGVHQFDVAFGSSVRNVISQLSNRIGYQMGQDEIYEAVHNSIRDKKMYKRTFYENCQSAVFRSMVKFLGFTEEQKPKTSGSGTRHVFTPPESFNGEHEGTFIFLERLWKDDLMNKFAMGDNTEMMEHYRATYSDHQGIERGWLEELAARINTKMPVDIIGAKQIAQLVAPLWCVPEVVEQEEPKEPDPQPDQNAGAEAQPEAEVRKYTKEEILFAIKNIFDEPDNDDFREILEWISGSDPANDWIMIQQALTEFGMRNYKAPLLIEDPKNVALMKFSVTVGDNVWEFARMFNAETYGTWDTVDNSDVPVRVEQIKTVIGAIIFLACMDIQGVVNGYSAQVESIIDRNRRAASHAVYGASGFSAEMTPAEAAAQILQSAQEEDGEDDEEEEYQTLAVHIFNDETFDIIKVSSGEAFGDVSIPFYTKLDKVSLEGGVPSIVDERNGIWDWMIHMVPDIVFQTKDPDHFMKDINVIEEGGQVKIVILDNDHGTYTMGLFWLSGVFIVDDEGNEEICTDPEILAKINRVIREDIGYGRISHLQRTLSMDSLVHDEAYVEEIIEQIDQEKKACEAEEGGEEGMEPEALNAAEAAAMRVIMGGAAALPDDATPKQKEFAEEVHKQAFAGLGVPTPEVMAGEAPKEEPAGDMGIPEEPAAPPAEEPAEETFEMNVPPEPAPAAPAPQAAPLLVVKKGSDSGDQGMTLPVRRRHH